MIRSELIASRMLNMSAIEDIHQIVDDLNHSIDGIQNAGDARIAEILEEIGQVIVRDCFLDKRIAGLILVTLRTLANEANLPPEERQLGVVRGALVYISMLNFDIFNSCQTHLGNLREFFGIRA